MAILDQLAILRDYCYILVVVLVAPRVLNIADASIPLLSVKEIW